MPYYQPYLGGSIYPRSPLFFEDFWGYCKFAILFLLVILAFGILLWNVQPWYEIKIVRTPAYSPEPQERAPTADVSRVLQRNIQPVREIRHVVAPGETLSRIAARYGVPEGILVRFNNTPDPNYIRAGEVILIPLFYR